MGAILLIAILASICVCVRKRGKAKEEEKRVLGYYVAPGMYAGGQEDANGMSDSFPDKVQKSIDLSFHR